MNFHKVLSVFSLLSIIVPGICNPKTNATSLRDSVSFEGSVTLRGSIESEDEHDTIVKESVERRLGNDRVCVDRKTHQKASQRFALLQLYAKFGIQDYLPGEKNENECKWTGVGCDKDGFVTSLRWENNEDTGNRQDIQIKTDRNTNMKELAILENLKIIDFSNQYRMGGNLPNLRNLKQLVYLDISYTNIIGAASMTNLCTTDGRSKILSYTPSGGTSFKCDCTTDDLMCLSKRPEFIRPPLRRGDDDN